jgi:Spy/CpxP family protein refolding chaperone
MKNRMATISIAVLVSATLAVVLAWAQTRDEIELTRTKVQTERQQIVSDYMKLTDKEAERFWPIYRDYRNDISKVNDRLLRAVESFAKSYDKMTDEQARTLLSEFQDIQARRVRTLFPASSYTQPRPSGRND